MLKMDVRLRPIARTEQVQRVFNAVVEAEFKKFAEEFLTILLGPHGQGGMPVWSGSLKETFEGIASKYGINIDYEDIHPKLKNESYLKKWGLPKRKENLTPAVEEMYQVGNTIRWQLNITEYFIENEYENNNPDWDWQQPAPPWGYLQRIKLRFLNKLRKSLVKNLQIATRDLILIGKSKQTIPDFRNDGGEVPF
jgi:hypothetical protein